METETLKPIDKTSLGEVTSHRAVTKVNALWPRKSVFPRAEPPTQGRRQHDQPNTDRYGWRWPHDPQRSGLVARSGGSGRGAGVTACALARLARCAVALRCTTF